MPNARFRRGMYAVEFVPVEEILPGPLQSRRRCPREGLEELRDSIASNGVLQPLTVRLKAGRFELIAGQRRLQAAILAGLEEVPCIVLNLDLERCGVAALVENLQRRELDFAEEAEGIRRLIDLFGLSQVQAARSLGLSQSAVANKLRVLRLPPEVLEQLQSSGFASERHARALLRLPDPETQRAAAGEIVERRMTVAEAEEFVDGLLSARETGRGKSIFLLRDVRLFLNALDRSLALLRAGGMAAESEVLETEEALTVTVTVLKPA